MQIVDESQDGDLETYTALLAACFHRKVVHSNLIAAVADTESYGFAIPRFVFINLRFQKPRTEDEWDLRDLNYITMP